MAAGKPGSPVTASELDRRALIEAPPGEPGQDAGGEPLDPWQPVRPGVAVSIVPLTGREQLTAQQVQSEATHRLRLRWRPGLSAAHRLSEGGRHYYPAEPPREIGRRQGLEFLATERAD